MNKNYETFYFENFIENYAATKGKAVLYLRSTGWNSSTDVDAINASYDLYKSILPLDIWTALKESEHVFLEVDDLEDTLNFVQAVLPDSQATTSNPVNYIFWSLVNSDGQTINNNE